jgi:threonine/homoserine/homoserine lactone efflux protein
VSLFLTAFIVGFAYAAAPGPVTTESIRRAARQGFGAGFLVQAGSLLGDAFWAIIGLTGAAILLQHEWVGIALGLMGAVLLLWLAREVMMAAIFPHDTSGGTIRNGDPIRIGIAFGFANPAGIAFWSGLGASMFGTSTPSAMSVVALVASFMLGATTWGVTLCYIVAWGSARAGQRLLRMVDSVSAVVLGWFGVRLLVDNLQRLRLISSPLLRALI